MAVHPPLQLERSVISLPPRTAHAPEPDAPARRGLRERFFRLVKAPLLGRYAVRWRWPQTVERAGWEPVTIPSASGAALAGVYARPPMRSKGVVVCMHPLRRDAKGYFLRTGRADFLLRGGYDVLAFDFNGFGESTNGNFRYAHDVLAAARFAEARSEGRPVHALAACFGGVWALAAAAREPLFRSIAIESPPATPHEYYARTRLARAFFAGWCRAFPVSAGDAVPIESIARLVGEPRVLLIAGMEDALTPPGMALRLFEAGTRAGTACRAWYVEGAGHVRAYEAAPRDYEAQVMALLERDCPESALVW